MPISNQATGIFKAMHSLISACTKSSAIMARLMDATEQRENFKWLELYLSSYSYLRVFTSIENNTNHKNSLLFIATKYFYIKK
jgi:hypothetical protein